MSQSRITPTRRQTMAWVIAAAATPLALSGCTPPRGWRDLKLKPLQGDGYGRDPDLMNPETPWPLTLTERQRTIVRVAADLIIPRDEISPSAGDLGMEAFVDEWISAPYPDQQNDRALILSGLDWLEREAGHRFDADFIRLTEAQRREIFDDIASTYNPSEEFAQQAQFFARLRSVVLAGFYTTPEGVADIGYMGNSPIQGPYPGPSSEALDHLREQLEKIGLNMPR